MGAKMLEDLIAIVLVFAIPIGSGLVILAFIMMGREKNGHIVYRKSRRMKKNGDRQV